VSKSVVTCPANKITFCIAPLHRLLYACLAWGKKSFNHFVIEDCDRCLMINSLLHCIIRLLSSFLTICRRCTTWEAYKSLRCKSLRCLKAKTPIFGKVVVLAASEPDWSLLT